MKQNILRRLPALALAVIMTLSLAATPAWAADPDANDIAIDAAQSIAIKDPSTNLSQVTLPANTTYPYPSSPLLLRAYVTDAAGTETRISQNTKFDWKIEIDGITDQTKIDEIATVTIKGMVTVQKANAAPVRVTATAKNRPDLSASFTVNFLLPDPILVNSVTVTPKAITLNKGQTSDPLTVTISPENATDKSLTWSSSNPSVATVDSEGKVYAVGKGSATITATAVNGTSGTLNTCVVTVEEALPSLKIDERSENFSTLLSVGERHTFRVTEKIPADAVVKWNPTRSTSNLEIQQVGEDLTVKALKATGTSGVTLTATLYDKDGRTILKNEKNQNIVIRCTVTVRDDSSKPITGIELDAETKTLAQDYSFTLKATLTPSNALYKTINWSTDNSSVATVDANGKVTAVGPGTAIITADPVFGTVRASCKVEVRPAATSVNNITGSGVSVIDAANRKFSYTFTRSNGSDAPLTAVLNPVSSIDNILWAIKKDAPTNVASVEGTAERATITRKNPGTTTITATPLGPDGKVRSGAQAAELTVIVSGVTMEKSTLTMTQNRRETLIATPYGDAVTGTVPDWTSNDPSVVTVNKSTGLITARQPGTAVITATLGSYTAQCTVTVVEDTTGLITLSGTHPAGSPINMSTARGSSRNNDGSFSTSGTLSSVLNAISQNKTGSGLRYVTNLSVASTDQGILHDQHHSTSDTGAGVGIQDQYYPGSSSSQSQRSLSDLSFVPSTTFSGTAEISYTGVSTTNQNFTGVIRVTVNGTGDVMYSSSEGSVVNFLADDFNLYHPNLKSVTFTPPLDTRGTLYYGYASPSQPGTKVTGGDVYHRTGTPSLDRVSFVPATGYEGTVTISYTGTDTAGRTFTGRVTITVTDNDGAAGAPGDLYYSMPNNGWVTFRPADFASASRYTLGETLSYVRFTLPNSSDGTLFYNYRGFSSYDSAVEPTTSYYYSGTPALSGVSFVPTTTTPGQVDIPYTGYTVRGNTFTGTIHIGERGGTTPQQNRLRYSVTTGRSVNLSASDLNSACVTATGASLDYVLFSPLPTVAQGTLRYTRGNSTTYSDLSTSTRCYRSSSNSWDVQLNNVSFLANTGYTGTVNLPFTGYNTNGASFTATVVIQVNPPTSGDSVYSGTTANPIRLSASRIRSASSGVLDGTLSYITFTSLPNSTAGRLYLNYSGFGTGTQVNTGTRYYASSSPSIDQISFVPRGRFSGQVTVGYTATNTAGRSVSGLLTFNISNSGSSSYFSDMGYHAWAAPAVDYLYQNGVTNGVTATSFGPDQHILRCDFVLMLCRAFHFSGGSGYSFADVPTDAYYANAVATAKQLGIVNGDGVNFMPYSELTRQDAMVMIHSALRCANWSMPSASASSVLGRFPDGSSVSSYARDAVSTLVQMGAVNGDNGMLYPYNPITRAEAAVILHFVMTM